MAIGKLYISPFSGKTDGACFSATRHQPASAGGQRMHASLSSVKNGLPRGANVTSLIAFFENAAASSSMDQFGGSLSSVGAHHVKRTGASGHRTGLSSDRRHHTYKTRYAAETVTTATQTPRMALDTRGTQTEPVANAITTPSVMQEAAPAVTAPAVVVTAATDMPPRVVSMNTVPKMLAGDGMPDSVAPGPVLRDDGYDSLDDSVVSVYSTPEVSSDENERTLPSRGLDWLPLPNSPSPQQVAKRYEAKRKLLDEHQETRRNKIGRMKRVRKELVAIHTAAALPSKLQMNKNSPEKRPFAVHRVQDDFRHPEGDTTARRTQRIEVPIASIHQRNKKSNAIRAMRFAQAEKIVNVASETGRRDSSQ